jgi:hypothetical protein
VNQCGHRLTIISDCKVEVDKKKGAVLPALVMFF